jgi:hypothetical protein
MTTTHDGLDQRLQDFINAQKLFFVATAPDEGRVNMSPKGMDTFRVLGPRAVAYQDLTGSGNETSAHLRQNGRITLMFCAFDANPLILRLYGTGHVIGATDPEWKAVAALFDPRPGVRQYMAVDVDLVTTSCGYGVPMVAEFVERNTLEAWAARKSPEELQRYWKRNNSVSLDGLPPHPLAIDGDEIA